MFSKTKGATTQPTVAPTAPDTGNIKTQPETPIRTSGYDNQQWNPNENLQSAIFQGNEANTRGITSFNSMAENLTNRFNNQSTALTGGTLGRLNNAYQGYNQEMRGYSDNMGRADQDIYTRNKGQAYAGLDSGFKDAGNELQASLARRGLSRSGIGAKAMGDLAQERMRAGAGAGVNAYTSAMDQSDARRMNRMNTAGNLYLSLIHI